VEVTGEPTVEDPRADLGLDTAPAGLLDTPALQHLLRQPSGGVCLVRAAVDDHVENSISRHGGGEWR
jgi:hypothetical protein